MPPVFKFFTANNRIYRDTRQDDEYNRAGVFGSVHDGLTKRILALLRYEKAGRRGGVFGIFYWHERNARASGGGFGNKLIMICF
jgi:hypothetical protein